MAETPTLRHLFICLRVIRYIVSHGIPEEASTKQDELRELMPDDLQDHFDLAIAIPGTGIGTFIEAAESHGYRVSGFFDEDDVTPDIGDWHSLISSATRTSKTIRDISKLTQALDYMESGNSMLLIEARSMLEEMLVNSPASEDEYQPHFGSGFNVEQASAVYDISSHPKNKTVFEQWAIPGGNSLSILIGGPGVGKTTGLVAMGCGYLVHNPGLVIHFSEEMGWEEVMVKYASCVLGEDISNNITRGLNRFKRKCGSMASDLVIESHASGSMTANELHTRVREICKVAGVEKPTAVIVDYLGLVRYGHNFNGSRYDEISLVAVGLRASSKIYDCPYWSAVQPQRNPARESQQAVALHNMKPPVLGLSDIADCWGVSFVSDQVLSLNQTTQESEMRPPRARIHRAKVRTPRPDQNVEKTTSTGVDYATCLFA